MDAGEGFRRLDDGHDDKTSTTLLWIIFLICYKQSAVDIGTDTLLIFPYTFDNQSHSFEGFFFLQHLAPFCQPWTRHPPPKHQYPPPTTRNHLYFYDSVYDLFLSVIVN